jgi:pimeloyl-ACP methyl ester carboxylesterase
MKRFVRCRLALRGPFASFRGRARSAFPRSLLLPALASAACTLALPGHSAPVFEDVPCDVMVVGSMRCGTVAVPRLYDDPDAGVYRLRVAVLPAEREGRRSDSVLILPGGPGGSPVAAAMVLASLPPFDLVDRDLVFIDARGVGGSDPQLCRENAMEYVLDRYQRDLTTQEMVAHDETMLERCFAEVRAAGHSLTSFGSKVDADDIEQVRQALGVESWNVFGVSYGAVTGLTLASRHAGSIRTLVLDSPGLGALTPIDRREGFASAQATLLAACAADPACATSYPDLGDEIDRVLEKLESEPLRIATPGGDAVLNRGDLELILFGMLYSREQAYSVPALVRAAAESRGEALVQPMLMTASARGSLSLLSWAATLCRDNPPGSKSRATPGPLVAFDALLPDRVCTRWVEPDPAPEILEDVAIPTLVLSGALDPVTPPAIGRFAASLAGQQARLVEFPHEGHGVVTASPCAALIWRAFLADPSAALDPSCVSESAPLTFALPSPTAEAQAEAGPGTSVVTIDYAGTATGPLYLLVLKGTRGSAGRPMIDLTVSPNISRVEESDLSFPYVKHLSLPPGDWLAAAYIDVGDNNPPLGTPDPAEDPTPTEALIPFVVPASGGGELTITLVDP